MGFLDIFSLFVLLVILALVVAILLLLAWLPGDLAKKRHSPWAEAIAATINGFEQGLAAIYE